MDTAGNAYGITGLAFQPGTNVLYASTVRASFLPPTTQETLVRINPATALVTPVGHFNALQTMADLTFDPTTGTLYGPGSINPDLYTINLLTGAATQVGPSGIVGISQGAGLASDAAGRIFGTPQGTGDGLVAYNKMTGLATQVANLSGAPFGGSGGSINALAFASSGTLYGVNSDRGGPAHTRLVTINTTTGAITDVGASLDNLDAIAFLAGPTQAPVPEPSSFALLGLGGLGLIGYAWRRRKQVLGQS